MTNKPEYLYDDPTGINTEQLEKPYQAIRTAINQTYKNANEWDYYSEIVESRITDNDIKQYIETLPREQVFDIKLLKVTTLELKDEDDIKQLYQHIGVKPLDNYSKQSKNIFVIEGSDNAITLYPMRLDDENIEIFAELFHMSPQIIQDSKNNFNKKDISNIKFTNHKDLKPKKKY